MQIAGLAAAGDTATKWLRVSAAPGPTWGMDGAPPTGRRFHDVDEIYIFRVRGGKLAAAFGVEDNMERMRQLGLAT